MTVNLQLKIPFELLERMKSTLTKMEALHVQEVHVVEQKLKSSAEGKWAERHNALRSRGRKLTIHNVARLAMEHGMPALEDPKEALEKIAQEGMLRGRPKE